MTLAPFHKVTVGDFCIFTLLAVNTFLFYAYREESCSQSHSVKGDSRDIKSDLTVSQINRQVLSGSSNPYISNSHANSFHFLSQSPIHDIPTAPFSNVYKLCSKFQLSF